MKSLTIGIKQSSGQEVDGILKASHFADVVNSLGLTMLLDDLSKEFLYTSNFLKDHQLEDENPFFNFFNIMEFNIQVDFEIKKKINCIDLIELLVFGFAQHISNVLRKEAIVLVNFNNMDIPICLFSDGKVIDIFEEYNSVFFLNKFWIPRLNKA